MKLRNTKTFEIEIKVREERHESPETVQSTPEPVPQPRMRVHLSTALTPDEKLVSILEEMDTQVQ